MYSSNETKPYHGRLWRGTVAAIFTCVCLSASISRAQEATEPTPEDMARSAALFEEAEVAYNAGDLAHAVELLDEAYGLYPEPVLLYNLARAHEALGHLAEARDNYEAFLEAVPDTPDRGAIERRLATLRAQLDAAEEARRRPPPPPPAPPPTDPSEPWVVTAAVVSVATLATLGVAATLGILSELRLDEARQARSHDLATIALGEAQDFGSAANILFVAGGVLGAVGLTGWIVALALAPGGDDPEVAVRVAPNSLALRVRWR